MNQVALQGRVVKNAIVTGEGRVLKFLLSCKHKYRNKGNIIESETVVPCVVFDPPAELRDSLQEQSKQSIYLACTGRVSRSSYEKPDGEKLYATDIILDPVSIHMRRQ